MSITLPPGQQLGSSENTTRFPVPSDVCMDQISSGIFTSSSYDDDFRATLTNITTCCEVNVQFHKTGEQKFILSLRFLCELLSCYDKKQNVKNPKLEPTSIAHALEDPDWVAAMQEEMQQFINQQGVLYIRLDVKSAFSLEKLKRSVWSLSLKALKNLTSQSMYTRVVKALRGTLTRHSSSRKIQGYNNGTVYVDDINLWVNQKACVMNLSQDKYVKDMLTKFDMESTSSYSTPLTSSSECSQENFRIHYSGCPISGRSLDLMAVQESRLLLWLTSSTEAEYVAAASCCAQVLWIQNQLLDYGFNFMNTKIFIDNQSTICIMKNPTRHLMDQDLRIWWLRSIVAKNFLRNYYYISILNLFVSTRTIILSAGRLVSAGRTMVLLVVILSAGCSVFAVVYAANTSIHAAGLVCVGGIMFLLADLFLLVVTCFCCAQLDMAGWLVYATSHLDSAVITNGWHSVLDDHTESLTLGREKRFPVGLHSISDYLDHSQLRYALTHDPPVVFDSLVKQFWATATVRPNAAGSHDLVATIEDVSVLVEGMIGNVKATKNKFLMYPRFLQMIVAIETADRTPRPTFGFTRKLFANMRFKWEGQPMPLTPPMLAIAAAGDAADEENAAAHEAAGSTAEAHPEPHSPPVSPVRELTPERQPETEWVVPNPVSPVTDWRPWPSVPAHSPIRDTTPEPASPPTPPAQTFMVEEPLVFGPAPRPARDVDPDVIDSIIFGPQPRPHGYVDPDFVEPIIFGPHPRPDNYLEPEDLDNLLSMEDDTTHGGFHVESPVRPDDAPTPTADAAGRAEDPVLLTSLSEKLDRCMGRIDSLETELGTTKKIMGGAILTLVSRVKKLEKTVKQLRTTRLVGDVPASEGDVDIQDDVDIDGLSRMASAALGPDQTAVPSENVEEREEEEVPLRRKRSAYRRARTAFSTPAFEQFQAHLSAGPSVAADKGKAPMPDLDIPAEFIAEDAQARKRFEAEQASKCLVQQLQAEALA
ncbi:hypothetical protein Tco_0478051 [Tanacetum coccineum]